MDPMWIFLGLFLASLGAIAYERFRRRGEVEAQFVAAGCLMVIFYAVCFLSGICTILNFLWKWIL